MKKPTAEYAQWLNENNFSPEDERLILRTVNTRMLLWALLSCIPGVGFFILPLLILAWAMRKIVKNRSFDNRPGLLFSFTSLAMYITFIMVIPFIIWRLAKRFNWGTGLRGLIKKGKIGNAQPSGTDQSGCAEQPPPAPKSKSSVIWIVIAVAAVVIAVVLVVVIVTRSQRGSDRQEETTISNHRTIPDFSEMTDPEQISLWASQNEMVLQVTYVDENGTEYASDPGGEILGVISQQPQPGKTLPPGSTVYVTLKVELPPTVQERIVGSWHFCDFDLLSLYLEEITFHEDGTFDTYGMGYIPVETEAELYLFGRYWSGAMGAAEESGTYSWTEDNLVLEYQYYDYYLEENISYQQIFKVDIGEDTLTLTYLEGDQPPRQDVLIYQTGARPAADTPLPEGIFAGVWVFHGEIRAHEIQEFDSHYAQGGQLILYEDGTFALENIQLSKSIHGGWYHMGGGEGRYCGNYTVENDCITLTYTGQYVSNYDNVGNWLGTELVPYEDTEKLILTSLSEQTEADFGDFGICDLMRIGRNPEDTGDWVTRLLDMLSWANP